MTRLLPCSAAVVALATPALADRFDPDEVFQNGRARYVVTAHNR